MMEREHRQYQDDLHEATITSIRCGSRRVLIQSPTGSGKSVYFSRIIKGAHKKEKRVLFLVHRRELVNQAAGHMEIEEVPYGIIMSGSSASIFAEIQLASIDTLRARAMGEKTQIDMPEADIVIIDEAHHVGSKTYERIFDHYADAIIIGVTATPARGDGKGLGKYFDDLVLGPTVRFLMDNGYLAEASYMVPNVPDLKGVTVRRGDYVEDQLAVIMNDAKLVGNVVDHWIKYAEGRQTIAFAVNVAHSRAIAAKFNAVGIPAAHIDGKTPMKERDLIIEQYEAGKFKILSNCQVFTEGTDMPNVSCILMAAPTKSLVKYLQMAGRGLRPKWDGGDCLIMDHTGNVLRHGQVDEEHDWSLDNRTIQERDAALKDDAKVGEEKEFVCSACGNIFKKQHICPKCGTPLGEDTRDVETARGELIELPKEKKKKKEKYSADDKQHWYSMFLQHAKDKGHHSGWAYYKYKDKFKEKPGGDFSRTLAPPNVAFDGYIKHLNIKASFRRKAS